MSLSGAYSYKNKKGTTYYLHKAKGRNGAVLYFFSKKPKDAIEMPSGKTVIENKATGLPILKGAGPSKKK